MRGLLESVYLLMPVSSFWPVGQPSLRPFPLVTAWCPSLLAS